jgi:hypothetical protein
MLSANVNFDAASTFSPRQINTTINIMKLFEAILSIQSGCSPFNSFKDFFIMNLNEKERRGAAALLAE